MISTPAIRIQGLGKRYRIGRQQESYLTLRESLTRSFTASLSTFRAALSRSERARQRALHQFWALRELTAEIRQGEIVGVVGRNGAGKSTLLKILARITEPTEGWVELRGRVGSLLEVGTGFHPELTGRENIHLNGAILGMSRRETNAHYDSIVTFAEVEKFVDTPVKRYSSGMYLRLAFSVAAHLDPEILLIDEVLAVGDAVFQKKCLGKMNEVARDGRTVLFVSHNLASVAALCNTGLLLHEGRLISRGAIEEVLQVYRRMGTNRHQPVLGARADRQGNGRIRFQSVRLLDASGAEIREAYTGQELYVALHYASRGREPCRNVDVALLVQGPLGEPLFVCNARVRNQDFSQVPGESAFLCRLPRLPLPPGLYSLGLWAEVNGQMADKIEEALPLHVGPGDFYGTGRLPSTRRGGVLVDYSWSLLPSSEGTSSPSETRAVLSEPTDGKSRS